MQSYRVGTQLSHTAPRLTRILVRMVAGLLAALVLASTPMTSSSDDVDPDRARYGQTPWAMGLTGGALVPMRFPNGPDFGVTTVATFGLSFRRWVAPHWSVPFAVGGAVFTHRLGDAPQRQNDVGLWSEAGVRRDFGTHRLTPFVSAMGTARFVEAMGTPWGIVSMGFGPTAGLEFRLAPQAGLQASFDTRFNYSIARRPLGRQRGNDVSIGGTGTIVYYF